MKKRGLTLVELLISIFILGVIGSAIVALFSVGIKNYRASSAKAFMQREVNLAADNITRDIKQSIEILESYNGEGRSPTKMFLALPSVDEDNNSIYNGNDIERDFIIYYLEGTNLHKSAIANASSSRYIEGGSDKIILKNVSSLSFTYTPNSPGTETTKVSTLATILKGVGGSTISIEINSSANKRNYE